MNITIDCRSLKNKNISGTERYVHELVKAVGKDAGRKDKIYSLVQKGYLPDEKTENINYIEKLEQPTSDNVFHMPHGIEDETALLEFLNINNSILTVLDLIKFSYKDYFISEKHYNSYLKYFEISVKLADKIISISEYTKKELIRTFGIDDDKIEVIHLGIDTSKFKKLNKDEVEKYKKKKKLPEKFILYIGHDYPHKNLKNLLVAFRMLLEDKKFNDYHLIIGGNFFYPHGQSYLKKELFAVKNKTIRLGYVPEEEICLLYNSCNLFVFPSLHEGFGFPVLEAFACEVPVICSNATSLPEVGGEGALYFNPRDPADISNKMKELLTDKEKSKMLIKKGVQRLKEFTWKKCAEKTFEVYKNTYNKSDFKSKYTAAKNYLEYIHQNKRVKKSKLIHNVKDLKTVLKMSVQSVINIGIKKTFGVIFKKIIK